MAFSFDEFDAMCENMLKEVEESVLGNDIVEWIVSLEVDGRDGESAPIAVSRDFQEARDHAQGLAIASREWTQVSRRA